jgi:hypothetical protein
VCYGMAGFKIHTFKEKLLIGSPISNFKQEHTKGI